MRARVGVTGGGQSPPRESGPREIGYGPAVCSAHESPDSGDW